MLDSKSRNVMIDNRTKDDIMLKEKIAQIDDLNINRIDDINEFVSKQLENFDDVSSISVASPSKIADYESENNYFETENSQNFFELEIQPNEFLDNMVWEHDDDEEEVVNLKKSAKFTLQNKSLFFAFTSIAFLLCILFIYNIFVIKSLEGSVYSANLTPNANISNVEDVAENNYIMFENSSTLQIDEEKFLINNYNDNELQTNWFDEVCTFLNHLFGGSY